MAGGDADDPDGSRGASRLALDLLSRRVREARTAVEECRHGRVAAVELAGARHELCSALLEYAAALEARHLPLPHALRLELQLHRQLFEH